MVAQFGYFSSSFLICVIILSARASDLLILIMVLNSHLLCYSATLGKLLHCHIYILPIQAKPIADQSTLVPLNILDTKQTKIATQTKVGDLYTIFFQMLTIS